MDNKSDYDKFNIFIIGWIVVFSVLFLGFALYFAFNKNSSKETVTETPIVSEENVRFNLNGEENIILNIGDTYEELGFYAISDSKGDIRSHVEVDGDVDTSIAGTYEITYTLKYNGVVRELVRTIKVKGEGEETEETDKKDEESDVADDGDENSIMSLYLNGEASIYVFKGMKYEDAGARAVNKNDVDVSDKIVTTGNVDTSIVGTYTITYSITDSKNREVSVSREVKIVDMKATIKPNVAHYTKDDIKLVISVEADEFSHIILPNGEKITNNNYEYQVSKNGKYSFEVYNQAGLGKRYTYTVNNIDKEIPTGSCEVTHNKNGSVITISAKDNIGMGLYVYNNKKYNTNKLTFSGYLPQNKVIQVGFFDKAGNYGTASCVVPKIS